MASPTVTPLPESRQPKGSDGRLASAVTPSAGPPLSPRLDVRLHRSYRAFFAMRHWLWRHVTPAGALLFWAMLAAGSFTDVGQTMAHHLFGLLFCILSLSLISVRKPKHAFAIERTLPRHASVGAPLRYRLTVHNRTRRWYRGTEFWEGVPDPRPTPLEFSTLAEPEEAARNWFDRRYRFYRWTWLCQRNRRARVDPTPLPDLPPGGSVDVTIEMQPLRRGRLVIGPSEIARIDPLGLFRRLAVVKETPSHLMIFPRRFALPPIPLPGRSQRLHSGGIALAGSVGDSEEFVSVREYRAGDPLRRIHWAGWARTQRPIVKEFQEEFFVRHALLLDTFAGGPESDAFEDAVSLAASFASTVDQRDSLLDLMFVGDRAHVFTGGRGLAHGEQLLEVLAGVELQPLGDPATLEQLVLKHSTHLSGCILILLRWDPPRRRLRERLESHRIPTLTFVVSKEPPSELDPLPDRVHWLSPGKIEETLAILPFSPVPT
ncbi:MAG: DUF58 domain-containing protein [Verrucomicrobiales bacterium]|nr:DUF58 domain-containing protein [Verrucomicrobiales bacterium]